MPVFGPAFFPGRGYEQPFVVRFPILRLVLVEQEREHTRNTHLVLGLCVRMSPSRTVAMIIPQNVARFARFDGFSSLKRISIFSVFGCFNKFTFTYFALSALNAVH